VSLLRRDWLPSGATVDPRTGRNLPTQVRGQSAALRQSVIWAAMSLRAATESLMPVDVFRKVDGVSVETPKSAFFKSPSSFAEGHDDTFSDWMYAGRMALDGHGNNFGEIVARDQLGFPARIQLVPPEDVICRIKSGRIVEYRFGGVAIPSRNVWHERQNLLPGIPVGASAFAYSALSITAGEYGREFAAEWFGNKAIPAAHLKNTEQTMPDVGVARQLKQQFKDAIQAGDLLLTGKEWTYSPLQAKAAESGLLEAMNWNAVELVRFFNVMPELVSVAIDGTASLQYANITQANLQFLVRHMSRSIDARERALSAITPAPREVKLNRLAWLALDPVAQAELFKTRIDSRTMTPDQARMKIDEMPLTEAEMAQFDRLFGNPNKTTPQKGAA